MWLTNIFIVNAYNQEVATSSRVIKLCFGLGHFLHNIIKFSSEAFSLHFKGMTHTMHYGIATLTCHWNWLLLPRAFISVQLVVFTLSEQLDSTGGYQMEFRTSKPLKTCQC